MKNQHIDLHFWQMHEVKKAISEAGADLFASDEQIAVVFSELRA